jgi:hypothetical protein
MGITLLACVALSLPALRCAEFIEVSLTKCRNEPCGVLQQYQAEGLIYFNLMRQRQVAKHRYRWSADGAA